MKKLLCFDLDDTVLNTDKSVNIDSKSAIGRALEEGHFVSIVTGRSIKGSSFIAEEIGMMGKKNCYLVTFQGNLIYDLYEKKIIFKDGIPRDLAIALLNDISHHGFHAQTFNENELMVREKSPEFETYRSIVDEKYSLYPTWEDMTEEIYPKVMAVDYADYDRLLDYQKHFYTLPYASEFDSFFSARCYLEFCKKDSNKGSGIMHLAEHLGLSAADVVAVGDERNDISMLESAGVGVAMQNSHPDVLPHADYVTKRDNNHGGVAEAIEKFIL